tara:strand:- start:1031 stop:1429 length:399 start_codon:yes stop_codon:yes gene_type:complete
MVNGVGFGSRTLNSTDIVELYTEANGLGSGNFAALQNGGSDYVVPAAKNLVIDFIICNTTGASSPNQIEFGYADDAAGTNFVKQIPIRVLSEDTAGRFKTECLIRIPTGKYPVVKATAANLNAYAIFRGVVA